MVFCLAISTLQFWTRLLPEKLKGYLLFHTFPRRLSCNMHPKYSSSLPLASKSGDGERKPLNAWLAEVLDSSKKNPRSVEFSRCYCLPIAPLAN